MVGEEERNLIRFKQRSESTLQAEAEDPKKRKRAKGEDKHGKKFHGTQISVCEIIFHCLQMRLVDFDWMPVQVNTGSPEQRFVVLRPSRHEGRARTPVFCSERGLRGLFCMGELPSRCGRRASGAFFCPKREPKLEQWMAYCNFATSRFTPSMMETYCLRAVEIEHFSPLEYFQLCVHDDKSLCIPVEMRNAGYVQEVNRHWKKHGLYDLRMRRCKFTVEIFEERHEPLLMFMLTEKLDISVAKATKVIYEGRRGHFSEQWVANMVDIKAMVQVLVRPRYAPGTINWVADRILCC